MSTRCLVFIALVAACVIRAEDKPRSRDFVRFVENNQGAQLQTGIASYRNAQGATVDLIGAIHVADRAYYEKLNQRFTRYDALLYEMVGGPVEKRLARKKRGGLPKKTKDAKDISEPGKSSALMSHDDDSEEKAGARLSWLHTLTEQMQSALALEGQMVVVDYRKKNFIHADMSLTEFFKLQDERNEGFITLWLRAVRAQMKQPDDASANQPGLLQIMEILCRKDSAVEFKRLIARTFDSMEMLMSGIEGKNGTVIITERNKVVIEVLEEQLAAGRKNLGVFYGSGHLPDMEQRLLALGFKRTGHEWFTAWDLPPSPSKEKPATDNKP